jgi:diacylglycerol kinase (ATP)
MKSAQLIHNPSAGEGEHSKKTLLQLIENAGFNCSYSSTKDPGWEKMKEDQIDFVIVAGGDGTVRKVADELLDKKILDKQFPIALIPSGTANNIGRTLQLPKDVKGIIDRWKNGNFRSFDVGKVTNVKGTRFILEGFGHGVFPELIKAMNKRSSQEETPELELQKALSLLHDIVLFYKARTARVVVDDKEYIDHYLLIEVMNIQSVGPNLDLAPDADPGDGELEVILIPESDRGKLARYVHCHLMDDKERISFASIKGKKITIEWHGHFCHADDQLLEITKEQPISIEVMKNVLQFMV